MTNRLVVLVQQSDTGPTYWFSAQPATTTTEVYTGLAVDSSNNLYCCGKQDDGAGNTIANITKINRSTAENIASKTIYNIIGSGYCLYYSVSVGGSGNVYAVGAVTGGPFHIRKYSSDLETTLWAVYYDYGANSQQQWITLDSSENVYVVWYMSDKLNITKLNSSGTLQWARQLSNSVTGTNQALGVGVDSSSNSYLVGFIRESNGSTSAVTIKYNSSGVLQWKKKLTATSATTYHSDNRCAVDSSGNVYHFFSYYVTSREAVLVKYDTNGTVQWMRKITGLVNTYRPTSVSIGADGYIYLSCTNPIFKYDSSGTLQWQRNLGSFTVNNIVANLTDMFLDGRYATTTDFCEAVLPNDGTKTGTYTIPTIGAVVYSVTTYSEAVFSIAAADATTLTSATSGISVSTPTVAASIVSSTPKTVFI